MLMIMLIIKTKKNKIQLMIKKIIKNNKIKMKMKIKIMKMKMNLTMQKKVIDELFRLMIIKKKDLLNYKNINLNYS